MIIAETEELKKENGFMLLNDSNLKLKPKRKRLEYPDKFILSENAGELAKCLAYPPKNDGVVLKRNLFILNGKSLYIQQEVKRLSQSKNVKRKRIKNVKQKNPLQKKLIDLMLNKNQEVISILEENDPGLLIQWDARACKTCYSVKENWAKKAINTCDELKEFLLC